MHEICIWCKIKLELNIWYKNLCLQLQRSGVSCSSWPGLHTLQQGFGTLLHTGLLQIFRVLGLSLGNTDFQLPQKIFYWVQVWRLARPLLRSHSLVALAVCLGSLSCWKTQPWTIFNALTERRRLLAKISRYIAPSILPSIRSSRPVPFAEKHPQSMMFSPPCFTVGMVFLGLYSSFFLQTRREEFIPNSYILVSSDHMSFSNASSGSSR